MNDVLQTLMSEVLKLSAKMGEISAKVEATQKDTHRLLEKHRKLEAEMNETFKAVESLRGEMRGRTSVEDRPQTNISNQLNQGGTVKGDQS